MEIEQEKYNLMLKEQKTFSIKLYQKMSQILKKEMPTQVYEAFITLNKQN